MFLIFVGSYSIIINSSKRLFFFIEKLCFRIFRVENISISCEFIFFSCFKFVQLFIKITSSILKAYSVEQEFWKTLILQSFSYFKLIKVFKSGLNEKSHSYLHRGSNIMFYLYCRCKSQLCFMWWIDRQRMFNIVPKNMVHGNWGVKK